MNVPRGPPGPGCGRTGPTSPAVSSPVNALVVVVPVEELHLLEGPGAGQVADDGGVHQEKQVQGRRSWWESRSGGERGTVFSGSPAQKVTFDSLRSQSDLLSQRGALHVTAT